MTLKGIIKFQRSVRTRGQECYGCTYARRDRFTIRVSEAAGKDLYIFAETLLHEFLHLWFFILHACAKVSLTERQHHGIINSLIPKALNELRRAKGRQR